MTKQRTGTNKIIQNERRRLLIDATITAISEHGLSNVTLAKIAKIAGLTAGSVNFHFDSKESLLLDTLAALVEEFGKSIEDALNTAGDNPAAQLVAMFDASLNPGVTEQRKMSVWYAFSSQARAREDYQRICGDQDKRIFAITLKLCTDIIRQGNKGSKMNPRAMANAIQGLIDEIWNEIFATGDNYDRTEARHIYLSFLASVFPWCYDMPQETHADFQPKQQKGKTLKIKRAGIGELDLVSPLFDLYRQFYQEPGNPGLARKFIGDNIRKKRSIIFLATDPDGNALGFTQLYPGLCSVSTRPFLTLYDLYVSADARNAGIGRALMNEAKKYAGKIKACRIELETETDNYNAQALYEDLGYQRDQAFYKYSLELD
jgi:TetR/AcrR family transcriptional repressor of bet genes